MVSAEDLNQRGRELSERGDTLGAEQAYRAAIEADPSWAAPYYNLGLLYKYQSRWKESLAFNQRAAALDGDNDAAWCNLGIAATALGNWPKARRAWAQCGMKVPGGDGPPGFNFGSTPVRLAPNGDGEVVWAHRIDPARAEILSVPLPESRYDAGDIVLTDGAANGFRKLGDKQYPVFDVLGVLQRSPLRKYVIELATVDTAAVAGAEAIIRAWLERHAGADLIRWHDARPDAT